MALLGQVAKGGDPAEERATRRAAMTVKDLCEGYKAAIERGLVMGKRGLPKRPLTVQTDLGRIDRHIIPLLGTKRVRELTPVDITRFIRDVIAGKTAAVEKDRRSRARPSSRAVAALLRARRASWVGSCASPSLKASSRPTRAGCEAAGIGTSNRSAVAR